MSGLSDDDLLRLVGGQFSGDWHDVAFSFSELLAYYRAAGQLGEALTGEQVAGWVFAVLVIADAMDQDVTEMEFQFNNLIEGFLRVRGMLKTDEAIWVLQRAFRRDESGAKGVSL